MSVSERIGRLHVLSSGSRVTTAHRRHLRAAVIATAVGGLVTFGRSGLAATFTTSAVAPTGSMVQISQPDNTGSANPIGYLDYTDNYIASGQTFTPLTNFSLTSFTFQGGGNAGAGSGTLAGNWNIYIGALKNGNYYSAPVTSLDTETADGTPVANDVANGNTTYYDTVTLSTPIALNAGTLYYWGVSTAAIGGYYQLANTPVAGGTYNQNTTSTEYSGGEATEFGNGGDNSTPPPTQIIQLQNADRTFFISGTQPTSNSSHWAKNGNGAYEVPSNWSTGQVPEFAGDNAAFDDDNGTIKTSPVVTLSTSVTIDSISFAKTASGGGYTIAQGGSGMINCGTNVTALSGTHVINVPFYLINNYNENPAANITVAQGASLTISNISGGSYGNVNVTGGGSLTLNAFDTWNLNLNGVTLTTVAGGNETRGGYDNFSNNAVLNVNTMVEIKQLYDDGTDQINIGSSGSILTEVAGQFISGAISGSGALEIGYGTDGSGMTTTQLTGNNANYSGPISVTNSSMFVVGSQYTPAADSMIGNGSATNSVTLDNGTLALGNGNLTTPTSITGNQPIIINGGGGTIDGSNGGTNGAVVNIGVGSISGPGTLQVVGATALTVNAQVVAANASGGLRTLALGGLNINAGSSVILASAALQKNRTLLVAGGLTLSGSTNAWTSLLDLGGNDLIVQNGSLATILNQAKQGLATGTAGIESSLAAADTTHLTALGIIQNSQNQSPGGTVIYSSFEGAASSSSDVLLKYTYVGDANLDGKVDGSDYSRIDSGFLTHGTGWYNGDFNYDGVVNGSDYTLIDNDFNRQGAQLTSELASATAQVGGSAVPEPTTLGFLILSAGGLLGRRRKCRHV